MGYDIEVLDFDHRLLPFRPFFPTPVIDPPFVTFVVDRDSIFCATFISPALPIPFIFVAPCCPLVRLFDVGLLPTCGAVRFFLDGKLPLIVLIDRKSVV